ncbi:unnamed protein product, partial [Iphiclides podalirius]
MRSIGGYGQRSRSARAATGCGIRILGLPAPPHRRPHTADACPETAENHVRALATSQLTGAPAELSKLLAAIIFDCHRAERGLCVQTVGPVNQWDYKPGWDAYVSRIATFVYQLLVPLGEDH